MAARYSNNTDRILEAIRGELVRQLVESRVDLASLTSKATEAGVIERLQGNLGTREERAAQFVAAVVDTVGKDAAGTCTELFLQVLEDCSLRGLANFVRRKLREVSSLNCSGTERHGGGFSPASSDACVRGSCSSSGRDSAIASAEVLEDSEHMSQAVEPGYAETMEGVDARHKMAILDCVGTAFKPISNSVVVVQESMDDLDVNSEDTSVPAIPETQPHDNPPSLGTSSLPLSDIRKTEQDNEILQVQLAESLEKEESLKKQLEEKEKELKKVTEEKDAQIYSLRAEIQKKEKQMEKFKQKLNQKEEENETLRKQKQEEIEKLEGKIKSISEKHESEQLKLKCEISKLELELQKMKTNEEKLKREITEKEVDLQKMNTNEERLKRQISEEQVEKAQLKVDNANLRAKCAEEKEKTARQQMEELELKHRNSISKQEKLEKELAAIRRQNNTEPDTS